ncbi:tyrosine-type recombinase/integrase [Frigoribacterium sp. PhB118]|uniref:tyrosine-type recombinase/integrase n=1 Tax=Frigoribacterium sp. PhB118 TaxID=2485175 RepID=UPI000F492BC6|nr:tyrosine-type recombinase/integrase [Frigoribacterium sp. PhB118]ROS57192.1 site-specific recombinase XerD [Frigoribacterium sp. PhB118]
MTKPLRLVVTNPRMRSGTAIPLAWATQLGPFTAWLRAGHRSERTIYLRTYHLRRFADETRVDPFDVTTEVLVDHLGSRAWSKTTRHSIRASLRVFYGWAHATGRMMTNPAHLLPTFSPPLGQPRPAPASALAAGRATGDPRVRLMVELAATVGMRCGEVAHAHTSDLRETLDGWSLLIHGKGSKLRTVPLNPGLAVTLRALPRGYLFPGQVDGHLSASYVSKLVSAALPDGWTAHTLRHRFASASYSADRDIRAVQLLLGHASVATTQVYTAVPDDALRRAVAAAA